MGATTTISPRAPRGNVIPRRSPVVVALRGHRSPASTRSGRELPTTSVGFGRQYGYLIWQRARRRHWQISAINKTFPCLLSWATWLCSVGYPFQRCEHVYTEASSLSLFLFSIAVSFHLPRHLSTPGFRAARPARCTGCAAERQACTQRRGRVLNGRVLIGPRPGAGTSGCPRVEFPPRRLLLR